MQVLIIGAGRMAYGVVFDLLKNKQINKIDIVDAQESALNEMKALLDSKEMERLSFNVLNADDNNALIPFFKNADAALSAVPYDFNLNLTKLAIEYETHFVDLGGNNSVVDAQFALNEQAKNKRIGIVPDCGLAPGLSSIIAAYAMDQLARTDKVEIRVGGLPLTPRTPLKYKIVFSVHGLVNEYIEPTLILEEGNLRTVESMTGTETLTFPEPFGEMEAFYTSGGISTMPHTFKNEVMEMDYKTIRYKGHAAIMKNMIDLGLTDDANTFEYQNKKMPTRLTFEAMLDSLLSYESDDVILMRVTAKGLKESRKKSIVYEAIEYGDKKHNLSAMMRMTAFPASIILQMLMEGTIKQHGVLKQETAIPGFEFYCALEKRGIFFNKKER